MSVYQPSVELPAGMGDVWAEIDLDAIAENTRNICSLLKPRTRFAVVVKADGYGHGAVQVARTALENGATDVAVSTVAEGVQLRHAGITSPILVMGGISPEQSELVVEHDFTPFVFRREVAEALSYFAQLNNIQLPVHLKINTGLNRFGVDFEDALDFMERVGSLPSIRWEGACTHLIKVSGPNDPTAQKQWQRFNSTVEKLAQTGYKFEYLHAAKSAALLAFPDMAMDMVRVGNLIYGMEVLPELQREVGFRPAFKMFGRVTMLHELQRGESVGYGAEFTAPHPMKVAVISVGFTDGWGLTVRKSMFTWRNLFKEMLRKLIGTTFIGKKIFRTPNGSVQIGQHVCPVIGQVSMQQVFVDVSAVDSVQIGSAAYLHCKPTLVRRSIPRLYVKGGSFHQVRPASGHIRFRREASSAEDLS